MFHNHPFYYINIFIVKLRYLISSPKYILSQVISVYILEYRNYKWKVKLNISLYNINIPLI